MTDTRSRWQQRFANYQQAFLTLQRTMQIKELSEAERGGLIQFFEMSLELGWKVMKDYLQAEGYEVKSPREVIKTAAQYGLIKDGELWLKALKDRNLTVHVYSEKMSKKIEELIKDKYFVLLEDLYLVLQKK